MTRKLEHQVDPDGVLSPEELAKAVKNARTAHALKMAEKSAKIRAQRKRLSEASKALAEDERLVAERQRAIEKILADWPELERREEEVMPD
jgi:hypothetical protein